MSVKDYIEKVKAKPEEEKKRIVFMWTIIIVLVIFLVWAISFSLSVANNQADQAQIQAEAEVLAKKQALAEQALIESSSTITLPVVTGESWGVSLNRFINNGISAVSEGFWTVGGWLHK
jgi:uncharacterized membrane protein YqiK